MSSMSKRVKGSIAILPLSSILLILPGACLILWPRIVARVLRWAVGGNAPEEAFRLCEEPLQDEAKRRSMSQALVAMSRRDAAETICESTLRLAP